MAPSYDELPEEIWELILNLLDEDHHSHFASLSIVSKRFRRLTDRLRVRFTVVDQTYFIHGTISRFISRFQHLKALDLSKLKRGTIESVLHEIACSSVALNLEALDVSNHDCVPIRGLKELGLSNRKLKVLKCANLGKLRDQDLIAIAKFHPCLEELDVSYPRHKFSIDETCNSSSSRDLVVTDAGIEVLSSSLKNLIKINISRNHFLTDKAVSALSLNCLCLREIALLDCSLMTIKGVRFLLHNSPNLRAISACIVPDTNGTSLLFVDPAISGRGICSLDLKGSDISDELLHSIAKAHIPLKKVSLSCCTGYTVDGISNLLCTYQSLEFLDLTKNNSLDDKSFVYLSQYLHDLVSIKINFCCKLTSTAMFTLINNCSFIQDVEMKDTNLGKKEDTVMNVVKYPNSTIQYLNLAGNVHMSDECLVSITAVCPNLKVLDVSSCSGITESLGEILRGCSKIRHLGIRDCIRVKNIGLNMELSRLESLYMARSGLNDKGLLEIGKGCKGLVKMDLAGCLHVSTTAVKDMVRKCEKLREIDLKGCPNVNSLIVDWVVFTRPSLKKIIPPSYTAMTEGQRKLLLRHGCQVCEI